MNRIASLSLLTVVTLGISLSYPAGAESRSWRSANGNRSFRAEFVSSDGKTVVLRRLDGKSVTVALGNLHPADRAWLQDRLKKSEARAHGGLRGACFDTLSYGDDRKTVARKLGESLVVTKSLDDRLVGRTGLNGIYQTTVGDAPYELFFHWTEDDELQEVTLRSKTVGQLEYDKSLRKTWAELVALLREHHGEPVQATGYPPQQELGEGKLLGSHLWHTADRRSILLCTGQEGAGYLVSIRFSAELIPPNVLTEDKLEPSPGKKAGD